MRRPLDELILEIRETHRRRQDFHRAEMSLAQQIKAIERRLLSAATTMTPVTGLQTMTDSDRQPRSASVDTSPAQRLRSAADPDIRTGQAPVAEDDVSPSTLVRAASALSKRGPITANLNERHGTIHPPLDTHGNNDRAVALADTVYWATLPLQDARAGIRKHRLKVERALTELAIDLPVYSFVQRVHGFGALGLGQIIGEAGDLAKYSNPAKLWKRMGLAVINGKSQRRVSGPGALEQGYSPLRRAVMFCIGDALLKKQNAYRELYLMRKAKEMDKVPDGSKMLWHRRAQRYCEKRLLLDLWRAWVQEKRR